MSRFDLVLLPGDGIGAEITREAVNVIDVVAASLGFDVDYEWVEAGAGQWVRTGTALTDAQFETCRAADALLMGAIGDPAIRREDGTEAASDVMFGLRFGLDLYAGVRPIRTFPGVPGALRTAPEIDYVVVREQSEGAFASRGAGTVVRDDVAIDTLVVTRTATERIVRRAFAIAVQRAKAVPGRVARVTCVDKSNVLGSYGFFRKVFSEVAGDFPGVEPAYAYVDTTAAQMISQPQRFDVVVAENLAGDILSDLAAATVGGLGFAPSGDIGESHAMFQPIHGTAPDIAGQGIANPMAQILSAAMLLRWLGERTGESKGSEGAALIEAAVETSLLAKTGITRDAGGSATTQDAGAAVVAEVRRLVG